MALETARVLSILSPLILAACGGISGSASNGTLPLGRFSDVSAHSAARYAEEVLYNFRGSNGENPNGGVTLDKTGSLYGTSGGGAYNSGAVFKLTPSGSAYTESLLYSFTGGADGSGPLGGVVLDKKGAIYGTTLRGGGNDSAGTVFKLTPSGSGYTESVLHSFCAESGCADGENPMAGLILDNKGALFGTTEAGGPNNDCLTAVIGCGTVFKLTPSGASYIETVLYAFCTATCDSGAFPSAGLVFGKDGALYETTPIDVDQCLDFHLYDYCGTVFKLTRSGSRYTETTIYTFCAKASCEDGADPSAALIFDKQGALWGTTFYGGTSNLGTVFKLTPSGSGYTESVLHSFTGGSDGAYPYAGLTLAQDGALYGTTQSGGVGHRGTVFKLAPAGSGYTESIVFHFHGTDGAYPDGGVTIGKQSALYGTTDLGGRHGKGTVFEAFR